MTAAAFTERLQSKTLSDSLAKAVADAKEGDYQFPSHVKTVVARIQSDIRDNGSSAFFLTIQYLPEHLNPRTLHRYFIDTYKRMLTLLFTRHYGKRRYRALYPQAFAFYDEPGDEHKTPHHHVVLVAQPSVSTLLRDLYSKNKLTNKALPSVKTFHLEDIDPSNQGLERVILYSCKTALRTDSSTAANDSYKIIELPKDIWGTNENK